MSGVEKIQAAEASVAEAQQTLALLQSGLERAEEVALAAEEAKARADQTLKVAVAVVAVSAVVLVLSWRKHR